MTNMSLPSPAVTVKDAQSIENIRWEDCLLLLKTGPRQLQLGLYQQETRYFIRLVSYLFETPLKGKALADTWEQVLTENKIRTSRCKGTRLIIDTPLFTSIPSDLYEDDLQESYFSFLYPKEEDQEVQTDQVVSLDTRLVYAIDAVFLTYAKKKFPDLSVFHSETILLRQFSGVSDDLQQLCLSLHSQYISLAAFSEGKLLLIQSYKAEKALDVVYYVLNAIQQLELPKENVKLCLTGFHAEAAIIYEKLRDQFGQTEWLSRPDGFQYPAGIGHYPAHYFYHLVSLALCES